MSRALYRVESVMSSAAHSEGVSSSSSARYPQSAGELTQIMGAGSATSIWLFNNSSGNAVDRVATNSLSPVSSPTQGVSVPALGGVCVQFTDNSLQSMDASADTIFDIDGSTSLLILGAFVCTSGTANNRAICGNRTSAAGNPGYEVLLYPTSGNLSFIADDSADQELQLSGNDYRDGNPHAFMARIDRANNVFGIYTELENSETTVTVGDMSGTSAPFSVGQIPVRNAAPIQVPWIAVMKGSGAEGVTGTHFQALTDYFSENLW